MGRYVGISYHVVSIHAGNHVMRVCAALVRFLWTAVAIVVRTSERLSVANAVMKEKVSEYWRLEMILRTSRSGLGRSIVGMGVRENMIAANTPAKKDAIRRSSQRHIVLGPQMSYLTAPVERPC